VRLDSANRSFAALAISSLLLGVYVLCGAIGCVLLPLIVSRLSHHGLGGLVGDGQDLLPAVAFVLLVGGGVVLGVRALRRGILASRALARRVDSLAVALPDELARVAGAAGLAGRVVLVDSPECFSFAYGALTPRVAVSQGLLQGVSAQELRAVLEHERYHVRNLDPLKVVLVRALPATFFFVPALATLRARYVAGRELAADRRAVLMCGRDPLVGALFKVARGPAWGELQAAAAIGGSELLDLRVAQLESGTEPKLGALTARGIALSAIGALLFVGAFIASIAGLGRPSAVSQATGSGMSVADLLGGAMCVLPFALGGFAVYRWIAWRARDPLTAHTPRTTIM
jgi:Zn-dependent protease with chaperone function